MAIRLYLRQSPRLEEELTDEGPDRAVFSCPLDAVVLREEEARVYAALSRLPMKQRQVMAWHLDGFTTAEIGGALGMQPAAVRQNLARARAHPKEALGLTSGGAR
ncbi:sigma-70 family RNA polymerase sigma factor [Streptomyces sp. XD-27]|uniref:sigma-70 family RNA polymerase sigma factor n=1 Tax=Streptomyces sp. XD-27 TaxID=3062779 RepID=UPI0026F45694|nr:sigma-70 family RNA polymerase sigma factor [Streptomyces sp. XD-27]WKX69392.1 sigma-70 family RNA polymerase sigma factor [Streptomyces sp. XD-27]